MQLRLEFELAEASHAERRNLLGLALMRVECDGVLSAFCQWVFNVTGGGLDGTLIKSYAELAVRPWGLCCSKSKARSTVDRACRLGIVRRTGESFASGGTKANGYAIDWPGIRRLLDMQARPGNHTPQERVSSQSTPVSSQSTPVSCGDTPVSSQSTPSNGSHAHARSLFKLSFKTPDPDPGAEPRPAGVSEEKEEPEILAAARSTRVASLPAGDLACGVFRRQDVTLKTLRLPGKLIGWFRRQLSAHKPATGDTEADLLLVMAAARYALELRDDEVRSSRVAVFAHIVGRGAWGRAMPCLPDARRELDRMIEQFGRRPLLSGTAWPPTNPVTG
jgi:hypothetical protein